MPLAVGSQLDPSSDRVEAEAIAAAATQVWADWPQRSPDGSAYVAALARDPAAVAAAYREVPCR